MNYWIPVQECLPHRETMVWVKIENDSRITQARHFGAEMWYTEDRGYWILLLNPVTHWMTVTLPGKAE